MQRPGLYVAVIAALASGAGSVAHAEPLLLRNQHPIVVMYGLPSPLPARLPAADSTRIAGVVNWSNFADKVTQGDAGFTLDGEVVETRVHVDHAFGERFALHGEVAYRHLSAGTLDGLITDWHEAFGLPSGSRTRLPEDQLLIHYYTGPTTWLYIDQDASGVADIPISIGYQLRAAETGAVATWLSIKAPTGKPEDFTGSGAVDVALSIAADHRLAERWQIFGQANLAWLGNGDFLPDAQENYALSGLAGVTWDAWRTLDLTVQIEGNTSVLDTGFDGLDGQAVVLTFGGSYRTAGAWQFDLGISEDLDADASPDFVLNLGVRHGW